MNIPEKLKENALNQLDQLLFVLGTNSRVSLTTSPLIEQQSIASKILFSKLWELADIQAEFCQSNQIDFDQFGKSNCIQAVCITKDGDTFLISGLKGKQITLTSYYHVGEVIAMHIGTWQQLSKDLDLIDTLLVVKRTEPVIQTAPIPTPESEGSAEGEARPNYIIRHFWENKQYAWQIIAISIVLTLLSVATPLGFQTFTDKVLPYAAGNSLVVIITLLTLAMLASSILDCFKNYQQSVLLSKYQNGLGKEVFRRLLGMEISYFDKHSVGDLTKLVSQVEEASNFLIRQSLSTVVSVISLLVVLPILFAYSVQLSVAVLAIGILMAVTIGISLKPWRERIQHAYVYDAGFQSTLIETLKGIKTIKSLANESFFRYRANTSLENNLYGRFKISKLSHIINAIVGFQSQMITVVVLFIGAQAVFANEMTIGQLIAFNMLAGNVISPLVSLVMLASGYETFKLACRKLNELTPPQASELQLKDNSVDLAGDIEFIDVWFKYPDSEDYVLKGICLTIKQGEIIGVVGGSGSGKSTLAALLLGFYQPTKGKIKVNGYDINLIAPEVLRSKISSVQQASFLFNTSIMENIHLGRLSSNLDDIYQALAQSGSKEFVDGLPQKYMTPLSEDGDNLSGGQRQRLAIARALVRNSDILLFDEATSALDNQTEDKIKSTIYDACTGKTGIIIAHRLNTLSYCHRLVVMSQGEIETVGTHAELIMGENSYKVMWQSVVKRDTPCVPGITSLEGAGSQKERCDEL